MTTDTPLAAERRAMSHILDRLMAEVSDLDTLCKHAPRLVSVAMNIARIQAALQARSEPDELSVIRDALLQVSAADTAEETPW